MMNCDKEQAAVDGLIATIEGLQAALADANPGDKPGIEKRIDITEAKLEVARVRLTDCELCVSCTPIYEPDLWNNETREQLNNCYDYACNQITDSNAIPGRAGGYDLNFANPSAEDLTNAVLADKLLPGDGKKCGCPGGYHLVAMVMRKVDHPSGWDYHFYRLDRNERWSHKRGGDPVTNLDASDRLISDPRTADRGSYTEFCGFFCVPNKVHIL
jgi:hypothetical protein